MNNVFSVNQCLESLGCVPLLGNEMSSDATLVLGEDLDVERSEALEERGIRVCTCFFGSERECKIYRNPRKADTRLAKKRSPGQEFKYVK